MSYRSLREFVAKLESMGELVRVHEPVSTVLEMTEIQTRLLAERGPAVIFEHAIKADGQRSDMPVLVNLRQDPFERFSMIGGETALTGGWGYSMDFYAREFWRFVMVQQKVAELAKTAIDYPPMQDPASFNLDAVKKQIETMIREHGGK